jgi:hypothetical protein
MHKIIILIILLFSFLALTAQTATPWQYVRHSAVDNNNQVHVRFNAGPEATGNYQFYHWLNNSWQELGLDNYETLAYEALLPFSTGQTLKWRLRNSYDLGGVSYVAVNPGFLSSDTFPPALASLGYIADDPVGDSVSVYFSNLDLTGSWAGWSNNKLYAALSNNANSFPVFNSLTSYNLYFAGIASSATAISDSSIYAMIYTFNIPGVITPGLYKLGINVADTTVTYQNLGSIQTQVVGGKLMLSCNISDLTSDPNFGTWPPQFNSLGFMAGSMRINLDLATMTPSFGIGDMTGLAQLIYEAYSYTPAANSLPVISDVIIESNYVQFTYSDANQDFPLAANIEYFDSPPIQSFTPSSLDFSQPVIMTAYNPMGWASAQILVSDNNINFVSYTIGDANDDDIIPYTPDIKVYPNPFNPNHGVLHIDTPRQKALDSNAYIYNGKGQLVRVVKPDYPMVWDGKSSSGQLVGDGVYILKYRNFFGFVTQKVLLVR